MDDEMLVPILYPAYIERQFKQRILAFFDNRDSLITEQGTIHNNVDNYDKFVDMIFSHNLLTFSLSLPDFPWLDAVVGSGNKPPASSKGEIRGIKIKGARNTTRWVACSSSWGYDGWREVQPDQWEPYPPLEWLRLMREVFDYAGVGPRMSPGSWGQAMFRRTFQDLYGHDWREHRHRRPSEPHIQWMKQEGSGARSEVFHLKTAFDIGYENDQHNAYGHALAQPQPTGKEYRMGASSSDRYVFYFVECEVIIPRDLPFGVFPVRVGEKSNRYPTFPKEAGRYITCLWKEEVELAREVGCTVTLKTGIGWKEATYDYAPLVEYIARLRDTAPKHLQPYLKLGLVAFTGSLNQPTERYTLVPGNMRERGDVCVSDLACSYDWWVHQEHDSYPQSMPHIFYHTLMLCRLSLYKMLKHCWEEELNVIATNTDAVITEKRPDLPAKGTPVQTGEWTALELHDLLITANRHLDSREKSVHPGIPRHLPKSR